MSERKIVEYKVINFSYVTEVLADEYFLYGYPVCCDGDIYQAMVKYED